MSSLFCLLIRWTTYPSLPTHSYIQSRAWKVLIVFAPRTRSLFRCNSHCLPTVGQITQVVVQKKMKNLNVELIVRGSFVGGGAVTSVAVTLGSALQMFKKKNILLDKFGWRNRLRGFCSKPCYTSQLVEVVLFDVDVQCLMKKNTFLMLPCSNVELCFKTPTWNNNKLGNNPTSRISFPKPVIIPSSLSRFQDICGEAWQLPMRKVTASSAA